LGDAGGIAAGTSGETPLLQRHSRRERLTHIALWLLGLVAFLVILEALGVDVTGWISSFWDQVKAIPAGYLVAALIFQIAYTSLCGYSYYSIFRYAYPGEVTLAPIVTAYAVGVAFNGFLPASLGTLVTLIMFVAIIPSATFSGSIAAYLVQKIFFTIAGTFVYVYMFLSVPNSFNLNFSNLTAHPLAAVGIVVGIGVGIAILARIFWRQVKKLWEQAKQGGAILAHPRKYMELVFLPSFLGWCSKLIVTGIFLAAFSIPVTFDAIMWVSGSGSLASVTSFTPGAIGVTQATNALALKTCCGVPQDQAVAYSTAQQLISTAWNVAFALLLVVLVFGWTGGKQLVGSSYTQAKEKAVEMRADRKRKKEEKKAAKRQAKAGS
jgi:uncharacterized membrane protein YbhN (UPF0104 family)